MRVTFFINTHILCTERRFDVKKCILIIIFKNVVENKLKVLVDFGFPNAANLFPLKSHKIIPLIYLCAGNSFISAKYVIVVTQFLSNIYFACRMSVKV